MYAFSVIKKAIGHKIVQIRLKEKDLEIHDQWIDQWHVIEEQKEEQIILEKDHDHNQDHDYDRIQDQNHEHQ